MSHVTITVTVMVTGLHDTEKNVEGFRTNVIIQHGNSILILW